MEEFLKELLELCQKHQVDLFTCYSTDKVVAQKIEPPYEPTEFEIREGDLEQ